jgi:hypothetical protein
MDRLDRGAAMSELLRCQACGGAVVWDAAQLGAACLFCGTVALELVIASEPVPIPEVVLPVVVSRASAELRFRAWATKSWFRPSALRTAEVGLHLLLLPAWRFHARLETHWAGLRPAATRSGKTPVAGVEQLELTTMVPASTGLSQAELGALQPFDESQARAWRGAVDLAVEPDLGDSGSGADIETIWEPPALTKRGARSRAHRELADSHRRRIARERGLVSTRVSAVIEDRDVRLMLVPIYIGTFRFRDRPWRFLVNGQTGEVVGKAPLDWRKIFALVVLVLALAGLLWLGQRPG